METKSENSIIRLPEINSFELTIDGNKYYSMKKYEYTIPLRSIKNVNITDLPRIEIYLEDIWESLENPYPDFYKPTFSILHQSEDNDLVYIVCDLPDEQWNYDVSPMVYLKLKYMLILQHADIGPDIICDGPVDNNLVYGIKGNGRTVGEIIQNAIKFDGNLDKEIDSALFGVENLLFSKICKSNKSDKTRGT
jgi:hypothetical protein